MGTRCIDSFCWKLSIGTPDPGLVTAVLHGTTKHVRAWIEHSYRTGATDLYAPSARIRGNAMYHACVQSNIHMIRTLVYSGADVCQMVDGKATCLHIVASIPSIHCRVTQELLCLGANSSIQDASFHTPLDVACIHANIDVALLFMDTSPPPRDEMHIPMNYACASGSVPLVQGLLDRTTFGTSRSLWTAASKGHVPIMHLLLNNNKVVSRISPNPTDAAAECGCVEAVSLLLREQYNPTSHAIRTACIYGYDEVVRVLIHAGYAAYPEQEDAPYVLAGFAPSSPLALACLHGRVSIVQLLLEAEVSCRGVLRYACMSANMEVVRIVLEARACLPVLERDPVCSMRTPCCTLECALRTICPEILEAVLDQAVSDEEAVEIGDRVLQYVLQEWALSENSKKVHRCVGILVRTGCIGVSHNVQYLCGKWRQWNAPILHCAVFHFRGTHSFMHALLEHGADPLSPAPVRWNGGSPDHLQSSIARMFETHGATPLEWACALGNIGAVGFFLSCCGADARGGGRPFSPARAAIVGQRSNLLRILALLQLHGETVVGIEEALHDGSAILTSRVRRMLHRHRIPQADAT